MKSNAEKVKANVVELKVYMHCRACERSVFNSLRTLKGVEAISTDMNMNKVIVKGHIDPKRILKRLKKKTGKRAELVMKSSNNNTEVDGYDAQTSESCDFPEIDSSLLNHLNLEDNPMLSFYNMFSDENPNACSIM